MTRQPSGPEPGGLPDFEHPPVAEVALAVSFDPLPGLGVVNLARLWEEKFKSEFPTVEEQPRWQMPVERLSGPAGAPNVTLQMMATPPIPRLWFINESGTELVQVQDNWFARNWRKMEKPESYPRYPSVRNPFESGLISLADFAKDHGLGEIKPNQCEVTYINHIDPDESWERHGQLPVVLELAHEVEPVFLPEPESWRLGTQYLISHGDGPVGRMYLSAEPVNRVQDGAPALIITLTARGLPLGDGFGGVMSFMDLAHEWIVRGFVEVTTSEMRTRWGQKRGS